MPIAVCLSEIKCKAYWIAGNNLGIIDPLATPSNMASGDGFMGKIDG